MLLRERLALLLVASLGAVFLPGALDRFVFPKLALGAAGVALALTVRGRGRLPRIAIVALCASAALLLVAAVSSSTPLAEILGRAPRYEGVIALPVYAGALLVGARLLGPTRAPGTSAWLLDVLSVVALAVGVEAVLEAAGLRPLLSNVSRPGSLLGNASDQGAWAVLALGPLSIAAVVLRERLHIAGALAAAATLATSGSRGALAGAVVLAIVLAVGRPARSARIALACGAAATAVGVLALPATRGRVLETSPLSQQTATGRTLLWSETLTLITHHPLVGVGPSGYVDAIPRYHDRHYEREIGPQAPPDSPHDWVLQAAAAGGPALALLAVALAALTLVRGRRLIAREPDGAERVVLLGLLAGLIGYAVTLLFHFTTAGTAPLGALYAGALLAEPAGSGSVAAARVVRLSAAAAYAGLTVVLGAAAVAELPLRSALVQAAAGNLTAAEHDFHSADDLRPWDRGVAQIATHAYAVLAEQGDVHAAQLGLPWAAAERRAYPDSVQALQDSATIDTAVGRTAEASQLLRAAHRLEPQNPTL
jgi:O-antigen ligase